MYFCDDKLKIIHLLLTFNIIKTFNQLIVALTEN